MTTIFKREIAMLSKILGIIVVVSQFISPAIGCDYNKLDSAVEAISDKIFNFRPMSEVDIKPNLRFLRDQTKVDSIYTQAEKFQELRDLKVKEVQNISFASFAGLCDQIYKEGSFKEKSAVHMLFEGVSNKTQTYLKLQQNRREASALPSDVDIKKAVEEFLNIDKVVPRTNANSHLVKTQ